MLTTFTMINKENVIRKQNKTKTVPINLRITTDLSKWLKEKNYSPTAIFEEATKELGYR